MQVDPIVCHSVISLISNAAMKPLRFQSLKRTHWSVLVINLVRCEDEGMKPLKPNQSQIEKKPSLRWCVCWCCLPQWCES